MIIGLYGPSRAGKDTVARMLQDKYDFEWRQFAKNLRLVLESINPLLGDVNPIYYNDAVAKYGLDEVKHRWPESVNYMIGLGQGVRDFVHEDAWTWGPLSDIPERLVISDVRQPNEAEQILALDGELWKIERPGGSLKFGMDGLLEAFPFNIEIFNTGTIEHLEHVVDAIMESR